MASKNTKKEKAKAARLKQKENRELKKKMEEEIINSGEEIIEESPAFKEISLSKFDGVRQYVILSLEEIISKLQAGEYNDYEILQTGRGLRQLAKNPSGIYEKYLTDNGIEVDKVIRKQIKQSLINTTERAFLKSQMQSVVSEYFYEPNVDYGALKVTFDAAYKTIVDGLEERRIEAFLLDVGYGDEISGYEVIYEDSFKKYDLKERIMIFVNWNSLDEAYKCYAIYKSKFRNFEAASINMLTSAAAIEDSYNDEDRQDFVEYNGMSMNYLIVLEKELKRLICQKYNYKYKEIRFVDAVNKLAESDFGYISGEETIEELHKLRKLRNNVAHGYSITKEDFKYIKDTLVEKKFFEFLSMELMPEEGSREYEYDTAEFEEFSRHIFKDETMDNVRESIYSNEKGIASHFMHMILTNFTDIVSQEEIESVYKLMERRGIVPRH